jgi:hypothetical protein
MITEYDNLDNYKIITLCGSTKFKSDFDRINMELTLRNKIILQPGCYAHFDNIPITDEQKERLDILHKEKIMMSDCIFVINVNNYIGSSTRSEIEFAADNNKPIFYLFE